MGWIPGKTHELVSGGYHGEMLHWTYGDACEGGKPKSRVINPRAVGHNRMIFNVSVGGSRKSELDGKSGLRLYAITSAQDRNLVVWDLDSLSFHSSIFTCGGFVYAMEVSPMDPTLVAVGSGDQYIRWAFRVESLKFTPLITTHSFIATSSS